MRRLTSVMLATGLVPAVIAFPTVTRPVPSPHPVKPQLHSFVLAGVDAAALAAGGPTTSRPYALTGERLTAGFTTVGVSWRDDPGVRAVAVSLRTRTDSRWTGWHEVTNEDDAPDPNSPDTRNATLRDGTAPVWTGRSDGIQVRVDKVTGRAPRDLRVDLIDPGTSAADAALGGPTPPASSASASANRPSSISRSQWGADESIRVGSPSYFDFVRMGFIHHTDTSNSYSDAEAAAQVRAIYAYHVLSRGWSDIGYNFLVDRFGRVFEGRYGGVDRPVLGAHTGGFNTFTFGVALLGTYGPGGSVAGVYVPSATLSSVERLFAWKLGLAFRDPRGYTTLVSAGGGTSRYPAGAVHTFTNISGHRDAGYTTCPGDYAYAQLPSIRNAVAYATGAGLISPRVSVTRPFYRGSPLGIYAGLIRPEAWQVSVTQSSTGRRVRTLSGSGTASMAVGWDLKDTTGASVPPGMYRVRIDAWISGNNAVPWGIEVMVQSPVPPNSLVVPVEDRTPTARPVIGGYLRPASDALVAAIRPPTWAFRVTGFTYGLLPRSSTAVSAPQGLAGRDPVSGVVRVADRGSVVTLSGATATRLGYARASLPTLSGADFGLPAAPGDLASPDRHPDGTMILAGNRVWMVSGGTRRPVYGSFAASYGRRPGLAALPGDPAAVGAALPPANATLVYAADIGNMYSIENGTRRWMPGPVVSRLAMPVGGAISVPFNALAAVTTRGPDIP